MDSSLRNEDGQHNNKEDLCIPHKSENNKAIFFHINGNIIQQEHCAIIHGIKNNNISKYQKEMSIYGFHEKGYYQSEMINLERKNIFKDNLKRNKITYIIEDILHKLKDNNAIFLATDTHPHDGNAARIGI